MLVDEIVEHGQSDERDDARDEVRGPVDVDLDVGVVLAEVADAQTVLCAYKGRFRLLPK